MFHLCGVCLLMGAEAGLGAGVGLVSSGALVSSWRGALAADFSKPGGGSRVSLQLPCH